MSNWKNETALVTEGEYGSGFWTWSISFDLEDLKAGKGEDAISVSRDHDTAGMSFSQYHQITRSYKLPDGVKVSAVQALIDDIVERAEELTEGFDAEWNGSNHVGRWTFENEDDEYNDASMFWDELNIEDLDCLMPYDLNYDENVPFVIENIKELGVEMNNLEEVEKALYEAYEDAGGDYIFTNFSAAAATIWERLQEERAEIEA